MALISSGILGLMWILGHDFSGHYNWLALISVDIISGVYCIKSYMVALLIYWPNVRSRFSNVQYRVG